MPAMPPPTITTSSELSAIGPAVPRIDRRAGEVVGCRRGARSGNEPRGERAMSATRREMHLGVFVLGTGNHSAGWRYEGAATSNNDLSVIQEIARQAERGKFDLLFVSDGLVMDPGDHPSFLCRFEPTTLISTLSASTRHLGLGATTSGGHACPRQRDLGDTPSRDRHRRPLPARG